jgi:RHS repeat-associated protein
MLTAGNSTFTYDDAGNTLTETNGSVVTTYTWDYLNRLAQWSKTGHTTQSYVYNADGMRVRVVPSVGTATDFLLDGIEIAEEIAGAGVTSYVGPGLISEISGTTRTIYHADGLGSTRAMSGSSQVVTESGVYDAYGNAVATYGAAPNFGYVGQYRYYTDSTGLHYLKARYYNPAVGRFLSRDPIGHAGGENLYAYVSNSPTTAVDPAGLRRNFIPPAPGWPVFRKPPILRRPIGPKIPKGGWIGIVGVGVCAADVIAIIIDSCGINGSVECAKQALKDTCDGAGPDPCAVWWDPRNIVDSFVKGCACAAYEVLNRGIRPF